MSGPSGAAGAAAAFAAFAAGLVLGSVRGIRHFRFLARAAAGSLRRLTRNAAATSAVTLSPAAGRRTADGLRLLAAAGRGGGGALMGTAAGPRRLVISMSSANMTWP